MWWTKHILLILNLLLILAKLQTWLLIVSEASVKMGSKSKTDGINDLHCMPLLFKKKKVHLLSCITATPFTDIFVFWNLSKLKMQWKI